VATKINSKSVDREDFKSGCLVVNSSSDVFFLIKTKEKKKKTHTQRCKGSKCNCRVGIRESEVFFPLISIFES
jgi:hypothetical protein